MESSGKILIIDDEKNLRRTLTRILQNAGYRATSAKNGAQGITMLDETEFDLVFLDIRLPMVDGLEVLKEIRNSNSSLPVIFLTGHGTLKSAMEAVRLGATDYLLKPVDPDILISRVRTILNDQFIERKRREIQSQIEKLQDELGSLDEGYPPKRTDSSPSIHPQDRFVKCGKLILDLKAKSASAGDELLVLPPAAFDYLVVLVKHSPEVVGYQSLVSEAQNYKVEANEASELAKWHIHILRQALERKSIHDIQVINVRSVGYRLLIG